MVIAISLVLLTCLMLSACTANVTSAPEIPRNSGEDQAAPMNTSTQVSSDVIADETCLPGGPSDTQLEYWEIDEFEDWMEQQRDQIQKLADNKDKSFYYKDDNGSYVCREWTQEDVDSLYESWQDQLALMKEGYHFTKSMELSNGGIISGAFDPETWNAEPASAPGSTIITLPDGSTVDLGHFDTADAATKAVQELLGAASFIGKYITGRSGRFAQQWFRRIISFSLGPVLSARTGHFIYAPYWLYLTYTLRR